MSIKILQWNVNSLKSRLEFLLHDQQPNIACLQETNFKENKIIYKGFNTVYKNRTHAASVSGGVAIYSESQ